MNRKIRFYPFKGNEINYIIRFIFTGTVVMPVYISYIILFSINYSISFSLKCIKSIIFNMVDAIDNIAPLKGKIK